MLTQNDLATGQIRPPHRLPPLEKSEASNRTPRYPTKIDIPLQEIRHQNDVERWRNKLRLQEKFEVRTKKQLKFAVHD